MVNKQSACRKAASRYASIGEAWLEYWETFGATVDKHGGFIDVTTIFNKDSELEATGIVVRIMERVFQTDVEADDAQLEDDKFWLGIGPEDPAKKKLQTEQSFANARTNHIFSDGLSTLESLLTEYDDVVRTKLGEGEPADI